MSLNSTFLAFKKVAQGVQIGGEGNLNKFLKSSSFFSGNLPLVRNSHSFALYFLVIATLFNECCPGGRGVPPPPPPPPPGHYRIVLKEPFNFDI